MGHGIPPDEWTTRFADKLRENQPQVPLELARELGQAVQSTVGMMRPEDAAVAVLKVQLQHHNWAADVTQQALNKIRLDR